MREGLAQFPYMAASVGIEPATFRTQGTEPTTEPPCPIMVCCCLCTWTIAWLFSG